MGDCLLVATEKDFDKDNRQKFIARCCTGNYDAVVMSYEQFEKISMSFDYRKRFLDREMDLLERAISDTDKDDRVTVKNLEKAKKNLEKRIAKLLDGGKTKDTSLSFDKLGFDCLVVDEAHNYKNGLVVTKMSRVAGVQTTPAQQSEDILMKTQYLNEKYGCKNIIFATGTPVTNSMTELYTMQRYLRPDLLTASGLQNFDDWASNFGEVVTQLELKPAGDGYRPKKRFSKFVNLPELMQMYKEFADIRTADMLNLPVPKVEGGKPQTVVSKPNDFQKAALQILAARSERIHSGAVDPHEDNMLKITKGNLADYFLQNGYECEQHGSELHIRGFGGLYVNIATNSWFQFSEQRGDTNPVNCLTDILGIDFTSAVSALSAESFNKNFPTVSQNEKNHQASHKMRTSNQ